MKKMEGPTVVHKPQPAAPPGKHVVKHRDTTPKRGNSLVRNADAVEAVPARKKTRHIAGLQVCAVNSIGSSSPNEGLHEEPDIEHSPANDQEDGDKEESEYVAQSLLPERLPTRSSERHLACYWIQTMSGSDGKRSLTVCAGMESSRKYPTARRRHMCRVVGQRTTISSLSAGAVSWRSRSPPVPVMSSLRARLHCWSSG